MSGRTHVLKNILLWGHCFGPHSGMFKVYSWFYTPERLDGAFEVPDTEPNWPHARQAPSSLYYLFL